MRRWEVLRDGVDRYIEGKTAFITSILRGAGFDERTLETITAENRMK